jgi:hypothetical protein
MSPQKFYPLLKNSLIVLHGDGFVYEFDIPSKSFKRLYFEFDNSRSEGDVVQVYTDSIKESFIVISRGIYYIIGKVSKDCFYKGIMKAIIVGILIALLTKY